MSSEFRCHKLVQFGNLSINESYRAFKGETLGAIMSSLYQEMTGYSLA